MFAFDSLGLIGLTLDQESVLLLEIKEVLGSDHPSSLQTGGFTSVSYLPAITKVRDIILICKKLK